MDREASQICELVTEAGLLLEQLSRKGSGAVREELLATLLQIRERLLSLVDHTADGDACHAACASVETIDGALRGSWQWEERGAA